MYRILIVLVLFTTPALSQGMGASGHPLFGCLAAPTGHPDRLATGDLNGDGVEDVVAVSQDGNLSVLFGQGDGILGPPVVYAHSSGTSFPPNLELADVDLDGDLDVVTLFGGSVRVYLNDGTGSLAQVDTVGVGSSGAGALALGDIDGDGLPDVVAAASGTVEILPMTSSGTLGAPVTLSTSGWFPKIFRMADMDGDGVLDLVAYASFQAGLDIRYGDGTFAGLAAATPQTLIGLGDINDIDIGDLSGDGFLDIIVGRLSDNGVVVFLNDGLGGFTTHTPTYASGGYVRLADIDQDGDLDAVARSADRIDVLENPGSGLLCPTTCPTQGLYGAGAVLDIALADMNGDGAVDILSAGADEITTILNRGDGTFLSAELLWQTYGTEDLQVADLDQDGDLDLVVVTIYGFYIYQGLGDGSFAPAGPLMPTLSSTTRHMAIGDINGDGWPDLVAHSDGGGIAIYMNQALPGFPGGSFAPVVTLPSAGSGVDLRLADLDNDGDLDIITSHHLVNSGDFGINSALNQGTATPTFSGNGGVTLSAGNTDPQIDLLDVNGDGFLDIVVTLSAAGTEILINDGTAGFTEPTQPQLPSIVYGKDVTAADINGDGMKDLVVGTAQGVDVVLQLPSSGTGLPLSLPLHHAVPGGVRHLTVADFNGDGYADVAFSKLASEDPVGVMLGNGTGVLAAPAYYSVSWSPGELRSADLDGDGNLELIAAARNRATVLEGGPFTTAAFPALGDDLALATGPGAALTGGPGHDVKNVSVTTTLGILVTSPGGTLANDPMGLGVELYLVAHPTPTPNVWVPGLWLHTTSPTFALLVDGTTSAFPIVPGPGGISLSAQLDPVLVGTSLLIQAATISPGVAANGLGVALTPAHLVSFIP